MTADSGDDVIRVAQGAVLVPSEDVATDSVSVRGYDFNQGVDYNKILQSYLQTGFQATHFGQVIEVTSRFLIIF